MTGPIIISPLECPAVPTEPEILCGKCKVPALPDDSGKMIVCPECRRKDTVAWVEKEVGQYIQHFAAQHIHKSLSSAVRGSKYLKVTSKPPPRRGFRWITDMKV